MGLLTGCAEVEPGPGEERTAQAQRLEGSTYTFNVLSDATVDAREPDGNFGSTTRLTVDGSPERRAYLRFGVSGLQGRIQRATLRLYVTDPSVDGPAVHATSNDWSFSSITWNNAPPPRQPAVADVGAVVDDAFAEYDVTSHVRGMGTFSFVLVSPVDDGVVFLSDNGASDERDPQLVIETEPCPAPTVLEIAPHFDTYVSEETPDTRYEDPARLVADGSPRREAYLSFGVPPEWNGRGARLRLFAKDGSTDGPALYRTGPLVEGGYFTWNTRPATESHPWADLGPVPDNSWAELNVTGTVLSPGEHAFALRSSSGDGVDFAASKEGQKHIPVLVLATGGPTCAYTGDGIGGTTVHVRQRGARGDEEPRALAAAPGGDSVVAGRFQALGSLNPADFGAGALPNGRGMALARYREDGTVAWTRGFLAQEPVYPGSVAVMPDGHILVAGLYSGPLDFGTGALPVAEGGQSLFIAKFAPDGQPVWSRGFVVAPPEGSVGALASPVLKEDPQGGLVLTGAFNGTLDLGGGPLSSGAGGTGSLEERMGMFLARFRHDGTHVWSRAFAHGGSGPTEGTALGPVAYDSILVGGRVSKGASLGDGALPEDGLFVARYAVADGALLWKQVLSGAHGEVRGVALSGGRVVFAGQFSGAFTWAGRTYTQVGSVDGFEATDDLFVGTVDLSGFPDWLRHFGTPGLERLTGLSVGLTGNLVLQGVNTWPMDFRGWTLGASGGFAAALSPLGETLWARSYSPSLEVVDGVVLSTGEVLVGGRVDASSPVELDGRTYTSRGDTDLLFLKLRP